MLALPEQQLSAWAAHYNHLEAFKAPLTRPHPPFPRDLWGWDLEIRSSLEFLESFKQAFKAEKPRTTGKGKLGDS